MHASPRTGAILPVPEKSTSWMSASFAAATGPSSCVSVTVKEGYAILSLHKEPVNSLDLRLWQAIKLWPDCHPMPAAGCLCSKHVLLQEFDSKYHADAKQHV
eukprot:scaffold39762_cov21-Tisochrysis_lutea.AAC.1